MMKIMSKNKIHLFLLMVLFFALSLLIQQQPVEANTTATGISEMKWDSVFTFSGFSNNGASQPIVAAAPNGTDVMVVFTRHEDSGNPPSNTDPFYSFSTNNGETWSTPKAIQNSPSTSPDIHATYDSGNRPHAAWSNKDEDIFYSRYMSGNWTSPVTLNQLDTLQANSPRISAESLNKIDIVWAQSNVNPPNPGVLDIYHARSTNRGVSWSATTSPIAATTFDAILPDLFVEGNTIHVVWEEQDIGTFPTVTKDVFYTVSTNGGSSWSTPINISDPDEDNEDDGDPEDGLAPHVYVENGRVHVLFTEQKGDAIDNQQFVHHTSCEISDGCTSGSNWTADGSISGAVLGANSTSPYSVLSTLGYVDDCVYAFFHGTVGGNATENEKLFGASSCNNNFWSNRKNLIVANAQFLRPDMATQDNKWIYLVYEKVVGSNRQIQFLRNNPESILYLPLITKP